MSVTGWIILYCIGFILAFLGSAFFAASRPRYRLKDDGMYCILGSLIWPGALILIVFFALEKLWEVVHDYAFYRKR